MDKFKVGQYVVFKDNPYLIHKVVRVVNDNQVELEYPNCGCVCHRIVGVALIRQATNNDYICTLYGKRMKAFLWDFWTHRVGQYNVNADLGLWLNQPYDGWEVER